MDPKTLQSHRRHTVAILLAFTALTKPAWAQSVLPTGGHVVAGSATIGTPTGNVLTINQTSNRAVTNWNSFSVGAPNTVNIVQPGSSAALLNRVTGNTPSTIAGQINANGQVYLVNPNGIAITPNGTVNVGGGFVASTLAITNNNFMSGNLSFTGNGASAPVSNAGRISAGPGGSVALIGGTAANTGVISVPLGKVALGSGEQATLDLNGDGFMQVAVPTGTTTAKGQALVSNSGRVDAAGGTVEMTAATVANAIRNAVNMSGVVAANSVSGHDGAIRLSGGPGGAVNVTGTVDTSAASRTANGGSVVVDGAQVQVGPHAVLNASGNTGGSVLVGVSAPGGQNEAAQTVISSGAQILAKGDPNTAGSGGHIETSGGTLTLGNAKITAGKGGTWLTDPDNLIIDSAAATTIDSALNAGTNVTEETTATGASGSGTIVSGNGDIDVTSALSWSTNATLLLSAFNNITVSAPITVSGGGTLVLTYNNNQGGTSSGGALTFVLGQGNAQFTSESSNPSLYINNGTPGSGNGTQYTLVYNTGTGSDGLQSLNNSPGNFALATSLDATSLGTLTTALIPTPAGNFDGLGNTVSNLTINSAVLSADIGLFGQINTNTVIANFGVTGGTITGATNAQVGALAGVNRGTIFNSYATGTVSGGATSRVGGLVGSDNGTISNAYATGAVSGGTGSQVGGLIGLDNGTISNAYATGAVSGGTGSEVGGLAGFNQGSVTNVYATGPASGGSGTTGALIGNNIGTITNGYYDTTTTTASGVGLNTGIGSATGLTTAQLAGALPTGFSSSVWGNVSNQTTPYILNNPGTVYLGTDTSATPTAYTLVFNATQLQNINNSLSGNFALAQDIDMTGVTGFSPIGPNAAFSGNFNGLGNVVSNLTINDLTDPVVGLFGNLTGTIVNVGVTGGSVTGNLSLVGGLVGLNSGTITNSWSSASVSASSNSIQSVGGLAGANSGAITNSYASGAVSGSSGGSASFGGLVGENDHTITNAYATGAVSASGIGNAIGGLVGLNLGTITNTYAAGSVSPAANVGGLVGSNAFGGVITNGYWSLDRAHGALGIAINSGTLTSVSALSGTQPFTTSSYSGFTFTSTAGATGNNWVIVDVDGSLNNGGGAAGATMPLLASEAQPTIQNAHQLQLIALNLSGSYTLGRSIDASATGSSTSASTGTDVWGTSGFVPLGGNGVADFTGSLNGLSSIGTVNTIANLTVNSSQGVAGLFGLILSATVENLGLTGGSITDTQPGAEVGGLAGYNNSGTITDTYATGAVSASNAAEAGGLVGGNQGTIDQSYAAVAVSGSNAAEVGGLVGSNTGTISNAYATGPVTGGTSSFVGGLAGVNGNATISSSYATGALTGGSSTPAGGLVASGSSHFPVTNGYFDSGTTGTSSDGNGATAQTTAQLQGTLPSGFSSSIWGTGTELYPYLLWRYPSAPQAVSGTVYQDQGQTPAAAGITVSAVVTGTVIGTALTGANGYYYDLLPSNTIPSGGAVLTYAQNYTAGSGTASGVAFTDIVSSTGAFGLSILANTLHEITSDTANSTLQANLTTAQGSNATVINLVDTVTGLQIDASGGVFDIDTGIVAPGLNVTLNANAITESAGNITAAALAVNTVNSADLPQSNAVGTVAAIVGGAGSSFDLNNTQSLTVGTVGSLSGVTTNGTNGSEANIVLQTTVGDIDIEQPVSTNGVNHIATQLGASLGQIGLKAAGNIVMNDSGTSGELIGFAVEAIAGGNINLDGSTNGTGNRIGGNDNASGLAQTGGTFSAETTGAGSTLTFTDTNAPLTIDTVTTGTGGGVAAGSLTLSLVSGVYSNGGEIRIAALQNTFSTNLPLTLRQPVNANNFAGGNPSTVLQSSPGLVELVDDGADLTQTASGVIIAGQLYARSGNGNVLLTASNRIGANDIGGIAQTAGMLAGFANNNFKFVNSNAPLTIGTVDSNIGIFTTDDSIYLATTGAGAITVNQPLNTGFEISIAVAPGYGFTNNASDNHIFDVENVLSFTSGLDSSFASAPIVILADAMKLSGGTIGAGSGPVVLGPATPTTSVSLGTASTISSGGVASGSLGLAQADINSITAGTLQIGYRNPTAGVSFRAPIDVAANIQINTSNINSTLLLVTGGAVTESAGAITATGPNTLALGVIAGSVAMNQQNAVGTLAAYTDGANANFSFVTTTALAVDSLSVPQVAVQADSNGFPIASVMGGLPSNPLAGITTANGAVSLTVENSSALAINQPIAAGTGSVTAASAGNLTIGTFGAVSGNAITLATLSNFTNNASPAALSADAGSQWLVYSTNPASDNDGGLTANFVQYAATYPVGTSGTPTSPTTSGNGLLYSIAPVVTVNSVTKTYDGTTTLPALSGYSISGGINGDSVALNLSGATGSYASANVGTGIGVTLNGATVVATNGSEKVYGYGLTLANGGAIGTITPATLTADLTGTVSKTYDGATSATLTAGNYTLSGIIGSDSVSLNDPSSGTYASANAGSNIGVSVSGLALTGAASGNYTLASATTSANVGKITPAALTAGLTGTVSKTYNGTTAASLTSANYSLSGVVGSDNVSLNDPASGAYASANAGSNIGVSVSGLALTGTAATNYTLATTKLSANIGAITPATLTAGLTGTVSKTYDGTTAATLTSANYTLSGIIGSDNVSIKNTTGAYASANVGSNIGVTVSSLALTGTAAGNYTLASTKVSANIGTITPAALTAGLTGTVSKTYDGTTAATLTPANYTLSGVAGSDNVSLNDPATGVYASANAGNSIGVNVSGLALTGTASGNYTLANTTASANIGTITPRPLMITANDQLRFRGEANPPLTYAITSGTLVTGDSLTGTPATPTTPDSPAGSYPITQGTLAASTNYAISFVDGQLTVLTVPHVVIDLSLSALEPSPTQPLYVNTLTTLSAEEIGTMLHNLANVPIVSTQ